MTRFGCPHARCPGCALIDLPLDAQRARKEARLAAALHAYPELGDVVVDPIVGTDRVTGYRTRAKWAVSDGEARAEFGAADAEERVDTRSRLGLYADGAAHEVVDIPGCVVAAPAIMEVATALRALLPLPSLTAVDLREVETDGGSRVFVTLVFTDRAAFDGARATGKRLMETSPRILGVFANLRDRDSPQMLGPTTTLLAGKGSAVDRVGSVHVFATPGSFVQAHRDQARAIEQRLTAFVTSLDVRAPNVLELYAGSGAFGLALAAAGARVTAVESFAPAAKSIGDAAALANVEIDVARADAEAYLERSALGFDVVVVDPPRRGLPPPLREALAARSPRAIAYVSCDPDTLARDLAHLARLGYRARHVSPIDMIPLTDHVEALAILERGEPMQRAATKRPGDVIVFDAGVSGARPDDVEAADGRAAIEVEITCFVTGVARARGKILAWNGGVATYGRTGVHSGHSELAIRVTGHAPVRLAAILDRLAKFGHPPLGDPKRGTPAATRYAFEALGLDRPFVHVGAVTITKDGGEPVRTESPLAPDLAAVRRRLVERR